MAVQRSRPRRGDVSPRRLARPVVGRRDGVQVSEIQRSRLLAAAVVALDEFGYDGGSVSRITARARISRRTFYDLFENREECLVAVLDGAVESIRAEIGASGLDGASWCGRVRGGLWAILSVFDREPALARVCVIESQRGGKLVLGRRQEILDGLVGVLDEGRAQSARAQSVGQLTAQGLVGAVSQIVYAHLLDRDRAAGSLRGLLGELMGMIVLPYMGAQAARREQDRPMPAPISTAGPEAGGASTQAYFDRLAQLPMRLTYRTAKVLQEVSAHPGLSNRQVGDRVGVSDQGQISKLLGRLERLGLLANGADGAPVRGEPNRWCLTPTGEQVASTIDVGVLRPRTKGMAAA